MPADNTYAQIERLVRRLTASSSESVLKSTEIQQLTNTFYNSDFPYAIKVDQMRSVYTFYTAPYQSRYPLNVNYNQGIRAPMYVDGIQGYFFKDRDQFYNMWPRYPTLFQPITGNGTQQQFTFTIGGGAGNGPILPNEISLGGTDTNGNPIRVGDDGNGNLQMEVPNPVISVPVQTANVPGMKNLNTQNPGDNVVTTIGAVNYVTGVFTLDFSIANVIPAAGQTMSLHVSQYQTGKPYTLLFWNNYFEVRPVPKLVHKIEIETYLTPVQFMLTTDSPILNQWVQYIAYGVSCEVLRQRQDMQGVQNLMEGMMRQESLVLERQAVEEIGQRNSTIFSSTNQQGGNWGFNQGWY